MSIDSILPDPYKLSEHSRELLFEAIYDIIFYKNDNCPHCSSENIVKYGKYKGKQRFMCNSCKKTFNDFTNSPLSNSRKPKELWLEYIRCMVLRLSLRKISKKLVINLATSFFWRHKILEAVKASLGLGLVQGVVEADEIYLRLNFKGNHKNFTLPRPANHTGEKYKAFISDEKVCIAGALDNGGSIIMDLMCLGRMSYIYLSRFYKGHINAGSVICTDNKLSYIKFAKDLNLKHKRIIAGNYNDTHYTIKHVKSLKCKFIMWLRIFQGVATKYLSNYIYWFKLEQLIATGSKVYKQTSGCKLPTLRIIDIKTKASIPV